MQKTYHVIGLMSGTSLDGLDIAYCQFRKNSNHWKYKILFAETLTYSEEWKNKLQNSMQGSALDFVKLDIEFGELMGEKVKKFIQKYEISPDFMASHGHTVFHQPTQKLTTQIGNGASLAATSHLNVVCDFRSLDVALGGQGAPLVPIGDKLLFKNFDYCLNLGGIANISMQQNKDSIAYDICPANMVLNALAQKENQDFDQNGAIAGSGDFDEKLFEQLNKLPFYAQKAPKSLGREWVEQIIFPILSQSTLPNASKMNTFCHHIAWQIAKTISGDNKTLLITGGGAFNGFLVEKIKNYSPKSNIHLPNRQLINYKEALIFAFLGVLRWEKQINCLASVTAAQKDNMGGAIYLYSN